MKIPRPLSQATTPNHHNIFTFILSLPVDDLAKPCFCPPRKLFLASSTPFPFHLLYYYSFLYSIHYGNKGASSPVSDVKLRYSVSDHTSSVHTLVGNSKIFRQEFSSLRLSIQYMTYAGSYSRWYFPLLSLFLSPGFKEFTPFRKFKTLSY
jgi:hypothetical protein